MNNPLHQILEKEMDRKEFLIHLGAGIMSIIGLSTIFKALNGASSQKKGSSSSRSGYGSGPYGA
jgi:hypothetical protein